jgi:lactate dehydrogenase-like 2-hydroxyacid dehydrogenase
VPSSDIYAVAGLHPFYMSALQAHFSLHVDPTQTNPAGFAELAPRITGLAASGESKVPASLMAQLPALKVISVFGVGYDGIDVAAARERGIAVTHTPGVLTDDVADLALLLVLAVARGLPQADQHVRQGRWPSGGLPLGRKVSGARLGVVGLGRIGQAIAQRAQGFGMSVAYTARSEKPASGLTFHATAKSLAGAVDFLVVSTPGGAATRHLIDADVLAGLGPDGYLINVARGSVVDEDALIAALRNGGLRGAGLDVFADEPRVPEAFWTMPNVVLTPHIASATTQTRQAMAELALANMQAGTAGRPVLTMVPELQVLACA